MFKKIVLFFLLLSVLAGLAGAGVLYKLVVLDPGTKIDTTNIEAILGKESPVFYNDNKTQLGVFFDNSHRQYVTFHDIPRDFVNALVAAEDNRFFSHFGFDIFGIARAMIANIKARRVVQGGSTLTQQTAKNLFKRNERSFKAKLKELLYALRLEYYYSKEKIFEFYANQFYVSGNGHGLGVAARYYFDKKPSELTLVESAFIAGSVKRPNYYNPFIKKTRAAADLAKQRAHTRLKYVLDKMLELEMIGKGAYGQALTQGLVFKQGKVGYSLDYVMEMVKDAVDSDEVTEALAARGVDNVSVSGIRIVTTVDKTLQQKTLYALRHELSRLDVLLHGYEREDVQQQYAAMTYAGDRKPTIGAFIFATVHSCGEAGEPIRVLVDFGKKNGFGIIDRKGLAHLTQARVKWQKNRWATPKKKDADALGKELLPGDKVWVSVREITNDNTVLLTLEKYPTVQGGALVMQDGMIRAMAGGTENRFFNRAVYAKRTMGSAFKPFLFAAALQLGWNTSDLLKNSRELFVFHNQPYYPRPDHKSPYDEVSMSWAGVHSENIAAVWLLVHLLDKLTPDQFKEVTAFLGLAPRMRDGEKESYQGYRTRIRDRFGIVVNKAVLKAAAYREAVVHSEADFIFEGLHADYASFTKLPYGLGFERFDQHLREQLDNKEISSKERKELLFRRGLLRSSYRTLEELREEFRFFKEHIESALWSSREMPGHSFAGSLYYDPVRQHYAYLLSAGENSSLEVVPLYRLQQIMNGLIPVERKKFWEEVRLDDKVSVAGFDFFAEQMALEYKRLRSLPPYSLEVLSAVSDFRIYVGLRYLIALGAEMGIRSPLEPILSFPLGANVTTLLETTRMYETLVTGKIVSYGKTFLDQENDNLLIIDRIESEDGELLYKPKRQSRTVLDDKSCMQVGHLLENVVKFGTGRAADKRVRLRDDSAEDGALNRLNLPVPLLGKTGTANRYTNASFYGYLPGLQEGDGGLKIKDGYSVGVYVGNDDNKAMRKGTIRITGSSGALPTWIDIVNNLLEYEQYGARLDPVDLSFNGLVLQRDDYGQCNLAVEKDNGGALAVPLRKVSERSRYAPSIMTFGTIHDAPDRRSFVPERSFIPFWKVEQ